MNPARSGVGGETAVVGTGAGAEPVGRPPLPVDAPDWWIRPGLEVIDVSGRVDYADFLVLMSGRSDRHVTALSSAIEEALRKRNKRALAVEGLPHASWVLMDFGDVVVHVFQDDARAAYDIDGLWMDARRVPVPITDPPPPPHPRA